MTVDTARRNSDRRPLSPAASERRTEALIAAYIHELSPRHHSEREAGSYSESGGRIVR